MVFETHESRESFFMEKIASMKEEIFRYVYAILENRQDAEDASQDSLLLAWERLEQLQCPEKARYWLLKIARNSAIDLLAGKSRYEAMKRKALPEGAFFNTEDMVLADERADELMSGIRRLPQRYQHVIRLKMAGLSPREVRELLGVSEKVRGLLLHRARKSLKKIIDTMD